MPFVDFGDPIGVTFISSHNALNISDLPNFAEILILDISNWNSSGGSNQIATLRGSTTNSSNPAAIYWNNLFLSEQTDQSNPPNPYLLNSDVIALQAANRDFALIIRTSNTAWVTISGFVTSVDQLPEYVQVPDIVENPAVSSYTSEYSGMAYYDNEGSWSLSGSTIASGSGSDADERYDGLQALRLFEYLSLYELVALGEDSHPSPVIQVTNSDNDIIEYDVDWSTSQFYNGSQPPIREREITGTSALRYLFNIIKQATPNGERGTLVFRQLISADLLPPVDLYVEPMVSAVNDYQATALATATQIATTESDYQAALAEYNTLLAAYNAALASPTVATEGSPGHTIRGTFTKTPRIDVLEPPTVPDEPVAPTGTSVEPVDPGELGNNAEETELFDGRVDFGGPFNRLTFIIESRDPDFQDQLASTYLGTDGTNRIVVQLNSIDSDSTAPFIPSEALFAQGAGRTDTGNDNFSSGPSSGASYGTAELKDLTNVSINGGDPRLVVGNYLLMSWNENTTSDGIDSDTFVIRDFDYEYDSGTTQDQIDAYQLALSNFNGDLQAQQAEYDDLVADRNTAIELLAEFNARDVLTRDDELPLDDMHIPALEEFALYYSYAIDDDVTANSGRAQRHWLAFFQLINKAEDSTLMITQAQDKTE